MLLRNLSKEPASRHSTFLPSPGLPNWSIGPSQDACWRRARDGPCSGFRMVGQSKSSETCLRGLRRGGGGCELVGDGLDFQVGRVPPPLRGGVIREEADSTGCVSLRPWLRSLTPMGSHGEAMGWTLPSRMGSPWLGPPMGLGGLVAGCRPLPYGRGSGLGGVAAGREGPIHCAQALRRRSSACEVEPRVSRQVSFGGEVKRGTAPPWGGRRMQEQ